MFEIGGRVGTPPMLDEAAKNGSFGHYARVLVEFDISIKDYLMKSWWNEKDMLFYVEIMCEKLREYFIHCKSIRHLWFFTHHFYSLIHLHIILMEVFESFKPSYYQGRHIYYQGSHTYYQGKHTHYKRKHTYYQGSPTYYQRRHIYYQEKYAYFVGEEYGLT